MSKRQGWGEHKQHSCFSSAAFLDTEIFYFLICVCREFTELRWHQDKIFRGRQHKLKTLFCSRRAFPNACRERKTDSIVPLSWPARTVGATNPSRRQREQGQMLSPRALRSRNKMGATQQEVSSWIGAGFGHLSNFVATNRMRTQAFLHLPLPAVLYAQILVFLNKYSLAA